MPRKPAKKNAPRKKKTPVVEVEETEIPDLDDGSSGLESFLNWKEEFKNHSRENEPPFRRGRIWA